MRQTTFTRPSRRTFLRKLAAGVGGAVALPNLDRLFGLEEAFGRELGALRAIPAALPSPSALQERYLLAPGVLYLNHASIGTVPRSVHEARNEYATLCESNPWLYMWGGAWEEPREATRASLAELLGAEARDVAITHNTTEGFNLLARGLPLGPDDEVLFSSLNHDGASVCWEHAARLRGFRVRRFDFPAEAAADLRAEDVVGLYEEALGPATRVLVFPHVDNAVGLRHPVGPMVRMARRNGVEFVAVDGAQTVGMLELDLPGTGVDFYAGSPHKWVQSPKGLGLLYVRRDVRSRVEPLWVTWGQRRWAGTVRVFEDYGTRNLPEVVALGDAADFQLALGSGAKERGYREMRRGLRERVEESPLLEWRSPRSWEDGASLVAVEVRGRASAEVNEELWREHGVVLRAFRNDRLNTLRISPNLATTEDDWDRFFAWIEEAAR